MKKAIFVADSHLKSPGSAEYIEFERFLDTVVASDSDLDALFILGDLFDFFVGFPHVLFYEHMRILYRLEQLTRKGLPVFYFEGNHDFFLRKLNKIGFPVNVVERDMDVQLNGRYLISHGDLINKKDIPHRIMSFIFRNPVTYLLAYMLPPYLVYEFAHFFSRFSRSNISSKRVFREEIFDDFSADQASRGYTGAILGHYHRTGVVQKQVGGNDFSIYLLGSWKYERAYLVWEDGRLEQRIFKNNPVS